MDRVEFSNHGVVVRDNVGLSTEINSRCAQTLLYAHQKYGWFPVLPCPIKAHSVCFSIRNFSSEDLALLLLQFWLAIISTLAVTNESIAHL